MLHCISGRKISWTSHKCLTKCDYTGVRSRLTPAVAIASTLYIGLSTAPAVFANLLPFPKPPLIVASSDTPINFRIEVQRLHPVEGTADLLISLATSPVFGSKLEDSSFNLLEKSPGELDPQYADKAANLLLLNLAAGTAEFPEPSSARSFSIPLRMFVRRTLPGVPSILVYSTSLDNVQLNEATPESYPFDSYALKLVSYLELPPGVALRLGSQHFFVPPMNISVAFSPTLSQMDPRKPTPRRDASLGAIDFALHRSMPILWFVVGVGIVPLLLAIALWLRLLARYRAGHMADLDWVLGVGAIALAVLPIRAVLVPADVTVITALDSVLGLALLLLAGQLIVVIRRME